MIATIVITTILIIGIIVIIVTDCSVFLLWRCVQPPLSSTPATVPRGEVGIVVNINPVFITIVNFTAVITNIVIINIVIIVIIMLQRWDLSSTIPCNVDEVVVVVFFVDEVVDLELFSPMTPAWCHQH